MMGVKLVGNSDFQNSVHGTGTAHMYAYDLAGRRTGVGGTYARTGTPQAASAATYNANNQLTQRKGASLTYDANGNLTSDGTNPTPGTRGINWWPSAAFGWRIREKAR